MDSVTRIKRLTIVLGVLMTLDIITTWVLMTQYGAQEAVITSRWLIEQGWVIFATVKMVTVAVAGGFFTLAVRLKPDVFRLARGVMIAACVFYVTPFIWNVYGMAVLNGWVEIPSWM